MPFPSNVRYKERHSKRVRASALIRCLQKTRIASHANFRRMQENPFLRAFEAGEESC